MWAGVWAGWHSAAVAAQRDVRGVAGSHLPRRQSPVNTSSSTTGMPRSRHASITSSCHSGSSMRMPPAPCGSATTGKSRRVSGLSRSGTHVCLFCRCTNTISSHPRVYVYWRCINMCNFLLRTTVSILHGRRLKDNSPFRFQASRSGLACTL